ncbi:MAG TPA: M20/M25/M40 family metallo-hydrolase [Gemmatimonadaceae bacterium]|nr:M20/M25/M40 family metallo-hydrolase [Gemmatimonadaceae bacterium]
MRTFAALIAVLPVLSSAQATSSSTWSAEVPRQPAVARALTWLEQNFPRQVEEWIRIAEMQGKSEHEQERGRYVAAAMRREGLTVSTDSIGNVIGVRKGRGGGPSVVFAAHLDIVHPLGTNLKVRRNGDTLHAPGIFDNSASVANMLAVIRALNAAKIETRGDLIFIGTAQEELGLKGMDYWLEHNPKPGILIAMDGGLGPINYGALGIYWTKYYYRGAGSHTVTSAGKPHPARAAAAAIQRIYEIQIPEGRGGAVYNIGQIHGGSIFNGIPQEVWFSMDLRSVNPTLLDSLDNEIDQRARQAAEREKVEFAKEIVQKNGAGGTEEMLRDRRMHPLVQTAVDIQSWLRVQTGGRDAVATGSTDSNEGVIRGIPSISIGRSYGGNQHTLSEWAHWPSALLGAKLTLLLSVTMGRAAGAGVVPVQ